MVSRFADETATAAQALDTLGYPLANAIAHAGLLDAADPVRIIATALRALEPELREQVQRELEAAAIDVLEVDGLADIEPEI